MEGSPVTTSEQLLIGGLPRAAASGQTTAAYAPATGETIAMVAQAGVTDVNAAAFAAAGAFANGAGAWPRAGGRQRATMLLRAARLIRDRLEELARLEARNCGKPITDARGEVALAADCFEYYAGLASAVGGRTVPVAPPGFDFTLREPIGVCALITPWNFPLAIASWKLAPALAAGNTVVLKPASPTPLTALALGQICQESGFPDGVVNVIPGPGAEIGRALVTHPEVAKVSFTGDTATGREIMRLASENIARISLELGGKSANIVFADADIDRVVASAPLAVFGNAGQDCCARSRILVQDRVADELLEKMRLATRALRVGDPLDEDTQVGTLISRSHRERVLEHLDRAIATGARIVEGGTVVEDGALAAGNFMRPAVLDRVTRDMPIAHDEVFGPVVAVLTFTDEAEAIAVANDSSYGLSGSLWTQDLGRALRVARAIRAGVISVNCDRSVHLEAPFGGYKRSGFGKDLGVEALHGYTEIKNVYIDTGI